MFIILSRVRVFYKYFLIIKTNDAKKTKNKILVRSPLVRAYIFANYDRTEAVQSMRLRNGCY